MTTDIVLKEEELEIRGGTIHFTAEEDAAPAAELQASDGTLKVGHITLGDDVVLGHAAL